MQSERISVNRQKREDAKKSGLTYLTLSSYSQFKPRSINNKTPKKLKIKKQKARKRKKNIK